MHDLPRFIAPMPSLQRPRPPILVGAGSPRMLDLAGRTADIVGIHGEMRCKELKDAPTDDLTAGSIEAKIGRVAAAAVGRPSPQFQFSCYHVDVTDAPQRSSDVHHGHLMSRPEWTR